MQFREVIKNYEVIFYLRSLLTQTSEVEENEVIFWEFAKANFMNITLNCYFMDIC